jgi:nucleolar protein 56
MPLYYLVELASGFSLFRTENPDNIGIGDAEQEKAMLEFGRFKQVVQYVTFSPFSSADEARDSIVALAQGNVPETLTTFLKTNLGGKKVKEVELAVADTAIVKEVVKEVGCKVTAGEAVLEVMRLIRTHVTKFIPELTEEMQKQAQLGLSHAYSRTKVQFNVNRSDNMIIQAISLLDQVDKDINTFAMRVKEWYGFHFPELAKVVTDNTQYCTLVLAIGDKTCVAEDAKQEEIRNVVGEDTGKTEEIIELANSSMGSDFVEEDMANVGVFAQRVLTLVGMRERLQSYLVDRMNNIAPNLSALVNEQIAARLISQAGSLTSLAKYPASTVQILGAEKALFRALKTRGKTPKYGLIYHTTFIGKSTGQNKGRISRYLANKCSLASRLDLFMDKPNRVLGDFLRTQVEERMNFLETGAGGEPNKNQEAMSAAMTKYYDSLADDGKDKKKNKKDKKEKRKRETDKEVAEEVPAEKEPKKKKKKSKKE